MLLRTAGVFGQRCKRECWPFLGRFAWAGVVDTQGYSTPAGTPGAAYPTASSLNMAPPDGKQEVG